MRSRGQDYVATRSLPVVGSTEVVSIDVFDTLVCRVVSDPHDVHELVRLVARQSGISVPADWRKLRVSAEQSARKAASRDVRLGDIYEVVASDTSARLASVLRDIEVEVELAVARPIREMRALYAEWQASGKSLVIVSDMYLPKDVIARILHECGYTGWSQLVVSGDDGVWKRDGSSFASTVELYRGRSVVHVGDNKRTDIFGAKLGGIRGILVKAPDSDRATISRGVDRAVFRRRTDDRSLTAALVSGLIGEWLGEDRHGREGVMCGIGFSVLGPLLAGFVDYLREECIREDIGRLVFLARDGLIMKAAFDARHADSGVQTVYGELSTRVLGTARLTQGLSNEAMRFLTKSPQALPAAAYVERILPGVNALVLADAFARAGVSPVARLSGSQALASLRPVFARIESQLISLGGEQEDRVKRYGEQLGLNKRSSAVVDIGWSGTMQRDLSAILSRQTTGFYLAVRDGAATRTVKGIHGWFDARVGGRTWA